MTYNPPTAHRMPGEWSKIPSTLRTQQHPVECSSVFIRPQKNGPICCCPFKDPAPTSQRWPANTLQHIWTGTCSLLTLPCIPHSAILGTVGALRQEARFLGWAGQDKDHAKKRVPVP
uniref:Uncharacterized protein n=1 Tax=Eutreptiella gymnastica TaxID=73025 RepID=A0A7S1NJT2_9EUGL